MAQKQGGSKKPRKRPGAPEARRKAELRKAKRVAAQKEREAQNKKLGTLEPKPWQAAKLARKIRRETANVPMQPRTGLGNIVQKQPDGTTRIIPGTSKETAAALEFRAAQREAELKEQAAKRADKAKKKANAEKANKVHKAAS